MTKFTKLIEDQTGLSEVSNQRLWAQAGTVRFEVSQGAEGKPVILEKLTPISGNPNSENDFMAWFTSAADENSQILQVHAGSSTPEGTAAEQSFYEGHGFEPQAELGEKGGIMIRLPEAGL